MVFGQEIKQQVDEEGAGRGHWGYGGTSLYGASLQNEVRLLADVAVTIQEAILRASECQKTPEPAPVSRLTVGINNIPSAL